MTVLTDPNPVLHQVAKQVTVFDAALQKTATQMRKAMHDYNGVGLAAPQVGISQQLAVIEYTPKSSSAKATEDKSIPFVVLCNPKITWTSREEIDLTEGCLSLPGMEGEVRRPKRIKVKAQDLTGAKMLIKASGLFARVLQHEIDHLNGILYNQKLIKGTTLQPVKTKKVDKLI